MFGKRPEAVPLEFNELWEIGAPSFSRVADNLEKLAISPDVHDALVSIVFERVALILRTGFWGDLSGLVRVFAALGITSVELGNDMVVTIIKWINKLDLLTLSYLGMSQPSTLGEYNLAKARQILKTILSDEDLSDEVIREILDWRHVLIALREQRRLIQTDSLNLLTLTQWLLQSGE